MGFSPSCPNNNWVQMNQIFLSASSFNSFQDSTIIVRKKDNILIENLKFMFFFSYHSQIPRIKEICLVSLKLLGHLSLV